MTRNVWFGFDEGPSFPGVTDGSRWNGFLNVSVTPAVRDRIARWMERQPYADDVDQREQVADFRALPVKDGLVYIGGGYATSEAPAPPKRRPSRQRPSRRRRAA